MPSKRLPMVMILISPRHHRPCHTDRALCRVDRRGDAGPRGGIQPERTGDTGDLSGREHESQAQQRVILKHHQARHKDSGLQKSRETQSHDLLAPLYESVPVAAWYAEHIQTAHRDLNEQNTAALKVGEEDLYDRIGHQRKAEDDHKSAGHRAKAPQNDLPGGCQTLHGVEILQRRFCRVSDADCPKAGDACRQVGLQRYRQLIQTHRHLRKKGYRQKTLYGIQSRFLNIAVATGIFHAALEAGYHQPYGKQCPAQIGEKQHHALYPAHGKELGAHVAHLRKEIAEKAHDLAVEPVHDLTQHRIGYKVPNKNKLSPP